MKKKFKLGIIGCGVIGSALAKGVILSDYLNAKKVIVSDLVESNLDAVSEVGAYTCNSNKYVAENSEFVVLAVRTKQFESVVRSLGSVRPQKIISAMEGIAKPAIKRAFGSNDVKVARFMPNLPCTIGSGAIGLDMRDFDDVDDADFIFNVLNCLGSVINVPESKMDAVAAVSGCGPVYAFMFMDSLIDAGIKNGLTKDEASALAVQTVLGAAEMVQRDEGSIADLIMKVCTKGGTAIEAVKVLEQNNFRGIVYQAVTACVNKLKEQS